MTNPPIFRELLDHMPFTIFFTAAGIVLAAVLTFIGITSGGLSLERHHHTNAANVENSVVASEREHTPEEAPTRFISASNMIFHTFHPIHLLFSALATTAMFFRYERNIWKAIITGFLGSVGICGLSDVFLPYLCGNLINMEGIKFHWCLIEHPQMVLPFVFLGIVSGLFASGVINHSTIASHSAHVFVSSAATLFYLISYGLFDWYGGDRLPAVFLTVILSVSIPCCLSDILFPLLVVKRGKSALPSVTS